MANTTAKKPADQDWHPADIKAALHKKGITIAGIAKAYGLRGSSGLSHVFTRSYPLAEQRFADAIGVPVQEIWPSRYFPDGTKRPRGFRAVQCNAAERVMKGNRPAARGNNRRAA